MNCTKKAILVISFGTSYNQSREKTIGSIEKFIAASFPDYEIRRAFTSQMIIKKLKERDGIQIDTVAEALEKLSLEKFETVICQPTHIMNGIENTQMEEVIRKYASNFKKILIGRPLLSSGKDYDRVVQAISREMSEFLQENSALILVGHGTEHFADAAYAALDYRFKAEGYQKVFVGTVEGYPSPETVISQIKKMGIKKAYLTPFMVVVGDHMKHDIMSLNKGAWLSSLTAAGIQGEGILKGLGEYPSICEIYAEHIREAIKKGEGY